jgi:hypothetical protein
MKAIRKFKRELILAVCLVAISIAGILLIKTTTQHGSSLHADSFYYMAGAEGLASGRGFYRATGVGTYKAVIHYPPLYSASIAGGILAGLEAYSSARVVNGLLFGGLLFMAGVAIFLSSRKVVPSVLCALAFLSAPLLIELHSWVLSEPLYLFLSLLSFLSAGAYLVRRDRPSLLVLSGALLACSALTRYVGVTLIASVVAAALIGGEFPWRRRLSDAVILLGISSGPLSLFLLRNWAVAGSPTNRPLPFWHPPGVNFWSDFGMVVSNWFIPSSDLFGSRPFTITLIALTIFLGWGLYHFVPPVAVEDQSNARFRGRLLEIIVLYLAFNASFLVLNAYLLDVNTLVNDRILSSLFFGMVLVGWLLMAKIWGNPLPARKVFVGIVGSAFLAFQMSNARPLISRLSSEPYGYATFLRRFSPTIEYIRTLPDVPIYSNDIQWISFWTDRVATGIPTRYSTLARALKDEESYRELVDLMKDHIQAENGVLIILGTDPSHRLESAHFADLTEGLVLVESFEDGLVYGLRAQDPFEPSE